MRDRVLAALMLEQAGRECQALGKAFELSDSPHEDVHSARKSIRRLRSTLALLGRGDGGIILMDSRLKAMASGLSALRDAHVAHEFALQLRDSGIGDASRWASLIAYCSELRQALLKRALEDDPGFQRHRIDVGNLLVILRTSCTCHIGSSQICQAIERSEESLVKAMHKARRRPEASSIHRWRRKARRLKMQLQAVARLDDDARGSLHLGERKHQRDELGRTVDILGRIQDLYLLRNLAMAHEGKDDEASLVRAIDAALTIQAHRFGCFSSPICLGSKKRGRLETAALPSIDVLSTTSVPQA